ncbi:MAG: urease subunit gamma/beta [Myxococcales bacterium]|jgi:urease subunit gamma/beta|nr:urease subunit gamma/beta [Myxococcales bacterium]
MHLSPRDIDKLLLHGAGFLAQKRLARGLRLNYPETLALLAAQLLELIRDGNHPVAELMDVGRRMLGRRQVLPGVPDLVHDVQVEGTFPDGTKLVTVHDPVTLEDGDLALALYGSFLPVPDLAVFGPSIALPATDAPGHVDVVAGAIDLYQGRARTTLDVTSRGDRPIQVGSHYPFAQVNSALHFDRAAAEGKHLDIPAGTAVRFEPGESRKVTLVENATSGGQRRVVSPAKIARTFDRASGLLPEYDDGDTV